MDFVELFEWPLAVTRSEHASEVHAPKAGNKRHFATLGYVSAPADGSPRYGVTAGHLYRDSADNCANSDHPGQFRFGSFVGTKPAFGDTVGKDIAIFLLKWPAAVPETFTQPAQLQRDPYDSLLNVVDCSCGAYDFRISTRRSRFDEPRETIITKSGRMPPWENLLPPPKDVLFFGHVLWVDSNDSDKISDRSYDRLSFHVSSISFRPGDCGLPLISTGPGGTVVHGFYHSELKRGPNDPGPFFSVFTPSAALSNLPGVSFDWDEHSKGHIEPLTALVAHLTWWARLKKDIVDFFLE